MLVFVSTTDSTEFMYSLFSKVRLTGAAGVQEAEEEGDEEKEEKAQKVSEDAMIFGCKVFKLHGNMDLKKRIKTFQDFKKAESGVMICTDVGTFFIVTCFLNLSHFSLVLSLSVSLSLS